MKVELDLDNEQLKLLNGLLNIKVKNATNNKTKNKNF